MKYVSRHILTLPMGVVSSFSVVAQVSLWLARSIMCPCNSGLEILMEELLLAIYQRIVLFIIIHTLILPKLAF